MSYSPIYEYSTLMDDTSKISDRRQTINNLLIGLNGLFLAGLFFPLLNYRLDNYLPVVISAAVTIAAIFVNRAWFQLNDRYRKLVNVRITYLTALEDRIRRETGNADFGIYHAEEGMYKQDPKAGFSRIEREFIWVLSLIYPLVTLAVAGAVTASYFLGLQLPTIVK